MQIRNRVQIIKKYVNHKKNEMNIRSLLKLSLEEKINDAENEDQSLVARTVVGWTDERQQQTKGCIFSL